MKRKILIIEDEKSLAQVNDIAASFGGGGHMLAAGATLANWEKVDEIIKAFDGENGVDKFYNEKPDLILLDINLPKKLGWEVCKEIRETSNIPIIMMTARDSDSDEYNGLSIGADDYITKPFNLKILLLKVKKLLKLDDNNIYKFENFSFDIKKQFFILWYALNRLHQ